ncbi:putative ABC transport system permease protein [Luteibacter rhizovicinus]|uniref:Putative ABC transport system permease protein n=1 Tax=Luteibacter rhizovicinus TaxID=242606 RepID=A0A4R3YSM2_9GAMM|nr:FtsX-like permease family protein [Luteibacter rhizovicinus]TCV95995.1 putative ABC transport system permease protein [Luteibacter rhizovicinus]
MKYLHLIWAALFRRKSRTFLTLVSILAAFLLFGMLDAVRIAFTSGGNSVVGVDRLIVTSRYSIIQSLPASLATRVAAIPGVATVGHANWFGGIFQDPKNFVLSFAVSDNYLDMYKEIELPADQRKAYEQTRTGAIVGASLAKRYGWKVGDKIPLQSTIFPRKNGDKTWPFDIVGIYTPAKGAANGTDQQFLFHWTYFDEANAYTKGTVGWYIVKLTNAKEADRVAKAIDALSANSDHETKSQSEQAFNASFAKQLGNIGLIVGSIMGAVFFTLILLTANTMAQAVRERTNELAVLKTIGFSSRSVLAMVLSEGVLLLLIGGILGLALAAVLVPIISAGSGGMLQLPPIGTGTWVLGIVLMIVIGAAVGALPAMRAMRLNIVDALAGR